MNTMNKVIYIGNIPTNCTESDLTSLFSPFGEVTHIKIPHNYFAPEKQLDFAFIKLKTVDQMIVAVEKLQDTEYQNNQLLLRIVDELPEPNTNK